MVRNIKNSGVQQIVKVVVRGPKRGRGRKRAQKRTEAPPMFFSRGPAPHEPLIQHVAQLINPINERLNALMMREQHAMGQSQNKAGVVQISNEAAAAPPAVSAESAGASSALAAEPASSASSAVKPLGLFQALHGLTKVALLRLVHQIGNVHGYSRLSKDDLIRLLATEHAEDTMRVIASYSAE